MDLREFIKNRTAEEIESSNKKQAEENEVFHNDFKDAYNKGCCSLCGNRIDYFNKIEKCYHWFLLPNGIRKKDFDDYLIEPIGYFTLECYFRWIASMESPLKNINDLSDVVSGSKLKEITIKYKNIEWSLNFGTTDLKGHLNSQNANFPHFHIQMLIDDKPFISFNDFHIPFSKEDLFQIDLMNEASDLIDFRNDFGEGMSFIENTENLAELDRVMKVASDENNAQFNTSSMIQMPEGKTMSGEILQQIFNESKETKIPIRHLIAKYYTEAKIVTKVFPGKGVPEMKKRNKR